MQWSDGVSGGRNNKAEQVLPLKGARPCRVSSAAFVIVTWPEIRTGMSWDQEAVQPPDERHVRCPHDPRKESGHALRPRSPARANIRRLASEFRG